MTVQCPVCTSTLEAIGSIDFLAPSISVIKCPVCNAPISVPAGFPVPMRWERFNVVEYKKPVVMYADVLAHSPALGASLAQSAEDTKGIYKDFSITAPLNNITTGAVDLITTPISRAVNNLAVPLVIVGAFLLIALYIKEH